MVEEAKVEKAVALRGTVEVADEATGGKWDALLPQQELLDAVNGIERVPLKVQN